jgi:hypothetical protein
MAEAQDAARLAKSQQPKGSKKTRATLNQEFYDRGGFENRPFQRQSYAQPQQEGNMEMDDADLFTNQE